MNEAKWRKYVSLEIAPGLEYGVCPRGLLIDHRGKINLKSMVEGSRKQVDGDRPAMEQLLTDFLTKSPLGGPG